MILYVLEGERAEPSILKTLHHLFPMGGGFDAESENVPYCFCSNIYSLYQEMTHGKGLMEEEQEVEDLIPVLQRHHGHPLSEAYTRDQFSEVYLFFDLDCQHNVRGERSLSIQEKNRRIQELLEFFKDETEHGKLYLSYPMVEALKYTKKLPDPDFDTYAIPLAECTGFKDKASHFSGYPNTDFMDLYHSSKKRDERRIEEVRANWRLLVQQHSRKAQVICSSKSEYPTNVDEIGQLPLFQKQRMMMEDPTQPSVSIVSAFPLFLVEYFGLSRFQPEDR